VAAQATRRDREQLVEDDRLLLLKRAQEDEPLVGGESFDEVASAVVDALLAGEHDVLTVLTGADAPELSAVLRRVEERYPDVGVDVHAGGQPHYQLLISAE